MITTNLGMRELITLSGNGVLVHGTYHKPAGSESDGPNALRNSTGVVFVNALSTPRAATGDSAVYWASSFAALGYPSFRFDLPGLGDSYGVIPNDFHGFINGGGYTSIMSFKIKELADRFGLSGIIVFGHCSGATNAVYAASECKTCKGLILLDPFFNLPKGITSSLRPELVHWARKSKVGELLRAAYDRMREMPKALRKSPLPNGANFGLISRWKQVASKGLPTLVLRAPQPAALGSSKLRSGNFDYLEYISLLTDGTNRLTVREIEGTDHSFANRPGRATVRQLAETWLKENFPETNDLIPLLQDQVIGAQERLSVTLGSSIAVHASFGE